MVSGSVCGRGRGVGLKANISEMSEEFAPGRPTEPFPAFQPLPTPQGIQRDRATDTGRIGPSNALGGSRDSAGNQPARDKKGSVSEAVP